ncbi:MAG: S9 family peptidase [Gemmatimonadota bacterium]|nr:MAG: S9 family peptidase [Gemmatimonadota bacterium]
MKRYFISYALLLIACVVAPQAALSQDPSQLTLDRIYASTDFLEGSFDLARWLSDGSGYATLEPSFRVRGGDDIVRYDPETGYREVMVPARRLVPVGRFRPLAVSDYEWSADGRKLLIFTNTRRVWRDETRGDYWVLDLDTWNLRRLGGDFDEARLMFAKFSPDASRVGYVYYNNIYVEDIASGEITQLTHDGAEKLINGTSDWVYEEEFDLRDCFRWSPDGKHIAYWQFDSEGVDEFYLINNTDSLYPKITTIPYPKAGTTNSAVRVGVLSASGGPTRWIEIEGDPRDNYIPRMEWAANSDELIIQRMNRLQNTNHLLLADAKTGAVREILTETDQAWLDVVDDLVWLDDGEHFTWVSERDGWRHLYVGSRSGGRLQLATPGEFDVDSVAHVDERTGWVYYIASPENPTQRYLYRQRLDGSGRPERLSPVDQPGTHGYRISADGLWAFHTYSRFGVPPVTELVRLPGHEVDRTLVANAELRQTVEGLGRGEARFFRVGIGGGIELDGYEMRPPDFDPSKKYPVLFYVYGEPWGQTARDTWGGLRYLWHLMLTQKGYIVISVDNRGTPSPRGRDWRKVVYKKIGIIASSDQSAAARAIGRWPYVDEERIGIWGWSGGGSQTLNVMFRYPDVYDTGMAVAPVPDIRLYDTIYQERYSGLPEGRGDAYDQNSPVTFAHRLEGNLLIVHGTGDDNVHYQGTERLINALIAAGKQFTVMPYPNRSHGIREGRGTTLHVYTLLTSYLMENMPPGPRGH